MMVLSSAIESDAPIDDIITGFAYLCKNTLVIGSCYLKLEEKKTSWQPTERVKKNAHTQKHARKNNAHNQQMTSGRIRI